MEAICLLKAITRISELVGLILHDVQSNQPKLAQDDCLLTQSYIDGILDSHGYPKKEAVKDG